MQCDSSLISFLPKAIDPKEIVAKARETVLPQYEEVSTANNDSTPSTKVNIKQKVESQLALAHEAIQDKHVTLTENGCWFFRTVDNETP